MTQTVDVGFTWCPGTVPEGLPVVQVYGWLLDDAGRVLVQDTGTRFNLPGGSPEPGDADLVATVVREAMEESQVTVTEVVYLGYEQVQRAGRPRALVRTVGRIGEFHPRHPDPDGGRLWTDYRRAVDQAMERRVFRMGQNPSSPMIVPNGSVSWQICRSGTRKP